MTQDLLIAMKAWSKTHPTETKELRKLLRQAKESCDIIEANAVKGVNHFDWQHEYRDIWYFISQQATLVRRSLMILYRYEYGDTELKDTDYF